ncbi:MAG: hypothetical protein H7Y31_08620 [Chitinophagaceae bacterium]|nr:hypothetical protein [Chitinophagaceae bacterium]
MQEEPLSGNDSLLIIQNMINKVKNQFSEDGFMYLLWGWVILTCSVGQFVLLKLDYKYHYMIWLLTWGAFIFQLFYLRKLSRKRRVQTYTDDILKYVWISFVLIMCLTSFVLGRTLGVDYFRVLNPLILIIYGIPTFLSGIILRFRPLVIGGIACWLLSIAATFAHYEYQVLLLGVAVIAAWIIPGFLLRGRYKKQNA